MDDHAVMREGLQLMLSGEPDLRVVGEASTEEELQTLLAITPIDMLLLDLNLPGADGGIIARFVQDQYPAIRVLVLSMSSQVERVVELFAAGACGYVLKTARLAEILHGIRTVASGRRFLCSELGVAALNKACGIADETERAPINCPTEAAPGQHLSRREAEVLQLLAEGLSNKEMAERLFTSRRTVETHRQNLLAKMQVRNTAALMKLAASNGWVQ